MNDKELHQLQAWRVLKGSIADMVEWQTLMETWENYGDHLPNSVPSHEECAISHIGIYTISELKELWKLNTEYDGTDSLISEAGDVFWCWFQLFKYYNVQQKIRNWETKKFPDFFPYAMINWLDDAAFLQNQLYEFLLDDLLDLIPRLLHKDWEDDIRGVDITTKYGYLLTRLFKYIVGNIVIWMRSETEVFNREYQWGYDLELEQDQVKMFFAILTEIMRYNLEKLQIRVDEGRLKTYDRQ